MPRKNISIDIRRAILLFLFMWALYGALTNLWDQYGYNLMHAGVESLAERGHFFLEGSETRKFSGLGENAPEAGGAIKNDVFWKGGHLYAVKHPGMFFLGALVYKPLSILGVRYNREYNLATSLVSWLTSGLLGALAVALLFLHSRANGLSLKPSLIIALSLGLSTIFFCYSGVLHHDFLTGCLLYFAARLIFGPASESDRRLSRYVFAGFLAGFAFTTSALAFFFIAAFLVVIILSRDWRNLLNFFAGCILGVMPLLIYNGACFGNPFLLPNAASGDQTVTMVFNLSVFREKLSWYLMDPRSALWTFSPILYIALIGHISGALKKNRAAILYLGGPFLLMFYVFFIPTFGGAQYGPRYILPAIPLLCIGLIPVFQWLESERENRKSQTAARILIGLCFAAGITICFAGAVKGTMYGMDQHPFIFRLQTSLGLAGARRTPGPYPLVYPMIFLAAIIFYFLPFFREQTKTPSERL